MRGSEIRGELVEGMRRRIFFYERRGDVFMFRKGKLEEICFFFFWFLETIRG